MKRISFVFGLLMTFSICLNAQNERVVKVADGLTLEGIYNNGTTVKKYVKHANTPTAKEGRIFFASDTLFVMRGEQIPPKAMVDVLSAFLKVPVICTVETNDIYDLDFNIKLENPTPAERKSMLEELGFEFTNTKITVKVVDRQEVPAQ